MSQEYKEPDSNILEPANPDSAGYPDLERELEKAEHKKDIEIDTAWQEHQDNQPPF